VTLGKFYGISVGPGDPELITLKGLRLLQKAAVVSFPQGLSGQRGIAEQTIAEWLHPGQIQVPLYFPYIQDPRVLMEAWQRSAEQVWPYLIQGMDVAFVCEGDVSFYSTFTYLAQTLKHAHPELSIEAVPGVCSPLAATAALGMPLTLQEQRLLILPALYHVSELEMALTHAEILVLMKVSSVYEQVWAVLKHHQLLDRSYVVERATQAKQVIYQGLRDHPTLKLPYFSLLIVQVSDVNIEGGVISSLPWSLYEASK
jgi:precorrin-2/cobalt-factor-2 C20-methyltransferase